MGGEQLGFEFEESPLELPVDPQGKGYDAFARDRESAIAKLNERFGVLIGQRVRIKLFGWDEEVVGLLVPDGLLLPESKKAEVPLRIGRVTFDVRDIEHCFSL